MRQKSLKKIQKKAYQSINTVIGGLLNLPFSTPDNTPDQVILCRLPYWIE